MIRAVLVLSIMLLLLWFLGNRNTLKIKAGKKLSILLFLIFTMFVVIFPEITDSVAHFFGVGRGADLLLYLLTITFITYVLNQYIRNKLEEQKLAKLARKVALLEAELSNK